MKPLSRITDIMYCEACDVDSPCIVMNGCGTNITCPNTPEWKHLDVNDYVLLNEIVSAINCIVDQTEGDE